MPSEEKFRVFYKIENVTSSRALATHEKIVDFIASTKGIEIIKITSNGKKLSPQRISAFIREAKLLLSS
ncbi:MAG TPA: hypothetical protein VIK28_11495 [Sedimentisphaerales bacterium]